MGGKTFVGPGVGFGESQEAALLHAAAGLQEALAAWGKVDQRGCIVMCQHPPQPAT